MSSFSARPPFNPPFAPLSGLYRGKESFAYTTLKDRVPVIISKTVDTVTRFIHDRTKADSSSEESRRIMAQGKLIIEELSKLRYELQCDKTVQPLRRKLPVADNFELSSSKESRQEELEHWNFYLHQFAAGEGSWFKIPWLFSECCIYRRIAEAFALQLEEDSWWLGFDWFREQKEAAFMKSKDDIVDSIGFLQSCLTQEWSGESEEFLDFLFRSLWGNQKDLSMHADKSDEHIKASIHNNHNDAAKTHLLADDTTAILEYLQSQKQPFEIHFVLDNAGAELMMDLCLADWLVSRNIASRIVFHTKVIPWFVSDAVGEDIYWSIEQTAKLPNGKLISKQWKDYLSAGKWRIQSHMFWTSFHAFADLPLVAPDLYETMKSAKLWIFKGDLNYRKLVYDCDYPYPYDTPFAKALGKLLDETPIVALRTCKADVVAGLDPSVAPEMDQKEGKSVLRNVWLVTGLYAVVQFAK